MSAFPHDHDGAARASAMGREPRTQGERIRWVRMQRGPRYGEPEPFDAFCQWLADASAEEIRSPSTVLRWERDEGRGPTLREGVAMARYVGQSADWLSALDEVLSQRAAERAELAQSRTGRAHPGGGGREASVQPKGAKAAHKPGHQGHGRGRKRKSG